MSCFVNIIPAIKYEICLTLHNKYIMKTVNMAKSIQESPNERLIWFQVQLGIMCYCFMPCLVNTDSLPQGPNSLRAEPYLDPTASTMYRVPRRLFSYSSCIQKCVFLFALISEKYFCRFFSVYFTMWQEYAITKS